MSDNHQYLDRVVIPFVALMFSLTGGMLHLVKLNVVISGFLTDKKSIKYGLALLLILAVMLIPEFKNNSITNSDAFVNVNQTRPVAESQAIKWIINTEDLMYPINESIRTHVLMGFSFQ